MPKVLTDKALIDKFLERGVDKIYPSKEALREKLLSGERLKVYQGFDPTGPYLHIGHAIGIRALRILQQLGHEVIFLVGDYTSRVGDPDPGKDKMRELLTPEQIKQNEKGWKEQAAQLIDFKGKNPVSFKHNYEWLSKLKLDDLIKLMSQTTVQQIIERDLFQKRIAEGSPIGLQEFIYPLMQGYDNVAMQVDIEIGGSDQTFNMLMGRTLCKTYLGKEKYVRTNVLMEAPNAVTMSKTKGNGINLNDSPEDVYGKAMSYSDELIIKGLTLLTDISIENIKDMEKQMTDGVSPLQFKKVMAYVKGDKSAQLAQKHFEETVQKGEVDKKNIMKEGTKGKMTVLEFLKKSAFSSMASISDLKRNVEQGSFEINGEKSTDFNRVYEFKTGDIIKISKRTFLEIV